MRFVKMEKSLVLPANYNRILYKFRPHVLNSEQEFLKIKSTDQITYQKRIKLKLKKEQQVYLRHHGLTLLTFIVSTLIVIGIVSYIIIFGDFKLFSSKANGAIGNILLFIFIVSFIISAFYYIRGFPSSLISFVKYKRDKYKFYQNLKSKIDKCDEFYNYKVL